MIKYFLIILCIYSLNASETTYKFYGYHSSSYLDMIYTDKVTYDIEFRNASLEHSKDPKYQLEKKIALLEAKGQYDKAKTLKQQLKQYEPKKDSVKNFL